MAETGVDYGLLQQILDEQGYVMVACEEGYEIPTGSVISGEVIWAYYACEGIKMVCIGAGTLDEWVDQSHKYFPTCQTNPRAGSTFFKLVAE